MISKITGGVLFILGTCIGGGMLALPIAIASGGFYHAIFLFIAIWFTTTLATFYILEVNLWLPENTDFISMAKQTLGKPGELITWSAYLFLFYSLLTAYTAGGSDVLTGLLAFAHLDPPIWASSLLFVTIFGYALFYGIQTLDWLNRGLMAIKLLAYVIIVLIIFPHVHIDKLAGGNPILLSSAVMIVVTAFGYAAIIPTLRTYFNSHTNALRITILIGSLIPLVCYLLWSLIIDGTLAGADNRSLAAMKQSQQIITHISNALSKNHVPSVATLIHSFTSVCIATAFLGVSLCLSNLLKDGIKNIRKKTPHPFFIIGLTLCPPLLLIFFFPNAFMVGLNYSGIFSTLLLILMPSLMVFSGRYIKNIRGEYQVMGGKSLLIFEMIMGVALLVWSIIQITHPTV